jgi:hypothetical protein
MTTNIFAGNYYLGQVQKFGSSWCFSVEKNHWRGACKTKKAAIASMMEYYETQYLFHRNVWRHIDQGDIRQESGK